MVLRRRPKRALAPVLVGLAPALLWLAFATFYYGFPLPNTYYAKVANGIPRFLMYKQGFAYLLNSANHDPITLATVALALLVGVRTGGAIRRAALSAALYVIYTVMLARRHCDDEWQALAATVAATGAWPEALTVRQAAMLKTGKTALTWDLTFPEVFRPDGAGGRLGGFDAVLSNPPWDIMQQNAGEFLAAFDLSILDAPTKREAQVIKDRLLADPGVATAFRRYQLGFQQQHRLADRLFRHQKLGARDEPVGGKLDSFRVFAERKLQLAAPDGAIGMVVPSAFHANEGATGIRQLYLRQTRLEWCLSFENRRKLFDIDSRFKFTLVVARLPGPTRTMRCAFYLTDFAQIEEPKRLMDYDPAFIGASGGAHTTLLELRGATDLAIARRLFRLPRRFGTWTMGSAFF